MTAERMNLSERTNFLPWIIWGLGAMLFFVSYFPRVAPSVMQDDLMRAFNINGFGFGTLTAFYLYAYVPMQVPVGMLVDKFGARRLLYTMSLLAGAGCVLFATSHLLFLAEIGRFMTGFGGAFGFVSAMKLAKDWFPSERLGVLAGLTQALGMLGATLGEAPVSILVEHHGWRQALLMMAVLFLVLSVLIFFFVQDKARAVTSSTTTKNSFFDGLIVVLRNPQSWMNAAYLGCAYAPVMAFAEAWGVSFLQQTYHISRDIAATGVGLIFLGWAIGGPLMGMISDHVGRKRPMIVSAVLSLVVILLVIFGHGYSQWTLFALLFLFGMFNTGVAVAYALSGEINPDEVTGTSVAFANMASIIIGMMFEPVIGWILDFGAEHLPNGSYFYSTGDYRSAMLVLPVSITLAIVFGFLVKAK
ncbi:MAG: MFS transporter [Gammaproteobacteria bacterium]